MKTRSALKFEAKEALRGNWGVAIVSLIIVGLIGGAASIISNLTTLGSNMYMVEEYRRQSISITPFLISIICSLATIPLSFGQNLFFLNIMKYKNASLDLLFTPYKNSLKIILVSLLMGFFTFLGFILLIVPRIILSFMFSQVIYIMVEEPEIGIWDSIKKSASLTKGYKMDLFVLGLSFTGWILLILITFGLAALWVTPYMNVTLANFYLDLKEHNNSINSFNF